jgi:hypothetical protein
MLSAAGCAGSQEVPTRAQRGRVIEAPQPQPGERGYNFDLDRDGRADVWRFTRRDDDGKETLSRKEKDLNGDGKVDTWESYGPGGALIQIVYDMDFDSRVDVSLFYEKGMLARKEYDLDFDKKIDTWNIYDKGRLARRERDTNGDGKVDYWEIWDDGQLSRFGVDTNGDGKADRWDARKQENKT